MNIAIIGAGNVGRALATSFIRAGQDVTLSARDPEKLASTAAELGAQAAASNADAVRAADVVILAVPFAATETIARDIGPVATGRVVVDVTNPVAPSFDRLATEDGPSAAERIQSWLPDAHVVKSFNTIFASNQLDPEASGEPADALVAGDDDAARQTVLELARSAGFRPIDAGPLARARYMEGMAFLNMDLTMRHGWDWRSAWRLAGVPVEAGVVAGR
jgi:hypothetical protein